MSRLRGGRAVLGGFSVKIGIDIELVTKDLARIARISIPKAKMSAFAHVGNSALTAASTDIAARAAVPKWMARGVNAGAGKKSSGARIRRTGYIPSKDGIIFYLLHAHINPAGTVAKAAPVSVQKKGVRAAGRTWRDSFYSAAMDKRGRGAIFKRIGTTGLEMQTIPLDPWAEGVMALAARRVFSEKFTDRFAHELGRQLGKRGLA
jgi:hypothetical protein